MNTFVHRIGIAALASVAAIALTLTPMAALAASAGDSDEARTILAEHPGGQEVAPGVLSWDGGAIVLTLPNAVSPNTIGTCATGQYCAWSGTSYTGTKLAFTACSAGGSSSSLSLLGGVVRSTANARTSGHVNAMNGSTVVYTMAANSGHPANSSTLTSLVCFT